MTHPSDSSNQNEVQAENQKSLLDQSTHLISEPSVLATISQQLFSSADARSRRRELQTAALSAASSIQAAKLKAATDNLALIVDVAEQTRQDELRIKHRHAKESLSSVANSQVHRSLNNLYVAKKTQLVALAEIQGDDDLKSLAATYLAEITATSARQLIDRNRKPR